MARTTPVTINQGNVVCVQLVASVSVSAAIESAGTAGRAIAAAIACVVPAEAAHHVVTELAPASGYSITVASHTERRTVTVTPGGS